MASASASTSADSAVIAQQPTTAPGWGDNGDASRFLSGEEAAKSAHQAQVAAQAKLMKEYERKYVFEVCVTGVRFSQAELMVRYSGNTDLPEYSSSSFSHERSYIDLDRLVAYLIKAHPANYVPTLPPQPPPSRALDRRSTVVPIETFLKRLVSHPLLVRDVAVIAFFDSQAAFNPPSPPRTEAPAYSTWSDKLKSLVLSGPRDIDAEFEAYKDKTADFEQHVKKLKRSIDDLSNARRELGAAHLDVGHKAASLGAAETDPTLANMWIKTSKKLQSGSDLYADHSNVESAIMTDYTQLATKMCDSVQHMLNHRLSMLTSYDDACRATEKQKRKMERLKGANSIQSGRVDDALQTLNQIKLHETAIRGQFRSSSDLIKVDKAEFVEPQRIQDVVEAMDAWAKSQADFEKRLLNDVYMPMKRDVESLVKPRKGIL